MGMLDGLAKLAARMYLLDPLDGADAAPSARLNDPPSSLFGGRTTLCVDGMDFGTAMRAHGALTRRLEEALQGQGDHRLDVQRLRRCDSGRLGRWLHGPGLALYGHLPNYRRLLMMHRSLHLAAADVLDLHLRGHTAEAQAMLDSGLYARYADLVRALLSQFFLDRGGRISAMTAHSSEAAAIETAWSRPARLDLAA